MEPHAICGVTRGSCMADNQTAVQRTKRPTEFQHNMFVLESLVTKDFKLKYRRSVLGILWSVLNPLLMMCVLAAVFSYMFRFSIENFPLYLILGQILFDFMNRSTSQAMSSIIEAQSLIKKVRIEKMVFPLEKTMFELVNFAISLVAVACVMVYFRVVPSIHALWGVPLITLLVFIFSAGLGLLISALSVFFRDVMHLWGVVLTAWTYATPLFYPVDLLSGTMRMLMEWNPMYHYVTMFRDFMMWNTVPSLGELALGVVMAVVTFAIGFVVFRKNENKFILYI